jgi:hypothetical protein
MTDFIESFATQQLLPPWTAKGARHWGFVIRLERRRIKAYLDTYFNGRYPDRAPYLYVPLKGHEFGLLGIDEYPNVSSGNPRAASRGDSREKSWDHLAHQQAYLIFPALRYTLSENNLLTDPKVVWVEPICFSNNDSVVFSSREIWGSDMFLAQMCRPDGAPDHQLHFDMGLIGMKKFSSRSVAEMLAVMHVKTGGDVAPSDIGKLLKARSDVVPFLQMLGGSASFVGAAPAEIGPSPYAGSRELNNLKQFRDCYNIEAAIYRGIVASQASHTEVHDLVVFDPSKVEIAFMWADCMVDLLTNLLNAKQANAPGPPLNHAPPRTPPVPPERRQLGPGEFHSQAVTANDMNWDMDRLMVKAEFAFTYSSDVLFEVLGTIHTYGVAEA